MNETKIEEGKLSDQEFVILPDSTLNSEDVGEEEPAASSTGLELPEDNDVVDDQVEFIMNTEVNRSIVRLASNRVSILTQVIGVNASQNCDSKDDCKNADRMKQVFIRNCSGNYDKQCCNELRGVAIGNLSDCCWNYLCREIAPFGGEEYLSDCIINRTCSNIPSFGENGFRFDENSGPPKPGAAGYALVFHDNVVLKTDFKDFPTSAMTFEAWISTSDFCHPGAVMSYAIKPKSESVHDITRASNHFVIYDVKNIIACHDFEYIDIIPDYNHKSCRGHYNKSAIDLNPVTGKLADREGSWRHLAVTWSQKNQGETLIYIDGSLAGRAVTKKKNQIEKGGAFMLGGEQDCFGGCTDPKQGFYGLMDEVRIWKTVRTQEQIVQTMRSTGEGLKGNKDLVAYWKFDDPGSPEYEGSGILADSSGRKNHLDILVPPKQSQVTIKHSGKEFKTHALTFKNNYAMNTGMEGIPTEDITVEFWARSGALTGSPGTTEHYAEFISFATTRDPENDEAASPEAGFFGTALIDDAIRIERYLTEYNETQYLKNTKTSTLGSISVHINSNRQGNGGKNDNWLDFATDWTDDGWHHIAVTWEFRTGNTKLYFDGKHIAPFWKANYGAINDKDPSDGGVSNELAPHVQRRSSGSFVLGQNQECYGGCFSPSSAFDGSMANLRIWSRVLDEKEIKGNMFQNDPHKKDGLALDFRFDKVTGKTERTRIILDHSGSKNLSLGSIGPVFQYSTVPLTSSNGDPIPKAQPGYTGYALELSDQQLLMLRDFKDFPTDAITVEFWMWSIDSCREGVPFSYAVGGYPTSDNAFVIFNYNNWGVAVMEKEGEVNDHNAGFGSTDGKWHHIAVTWESSTGMTRLYDNGKLQWEVIRAKGTKIQAGGTLVIGREQDCVGGCFDSASGAAGDVQQKKNQEYGPQDFYGIIEDVRIWKSVRDGYEIQLGMIYDKEVGSGKENDFIKSNDRQLVAWWKFDEGKGYSVKDETGHGHTLRILSEPKWIVPRWVETCGDGILEGTEECDDGNRKEGDGCSSYCWVEPGWICSFTSPSKCRKDYTVTEDSTEEMYVQTEQGSVTVNSDTSTQTQSSSSSSSSSSASHSGGKSHSGVVGFFIFLIVLAVLVGIAVLVYKKREAFYEQFPGLRGFVGSTQDRLNRAMGRHSHAYDLAPVNPEETYVSPGFVDAQPPASTQSSSANVPYEPMRDGK
eukprot:g2516.t1